MTLEQQQSQEQASADAFAEGWNEDAVAVPAADEGEAQPNEGSPQSSEQQAEAGTQEPPASADQGQAGGHQEAAPVDEEERRRIANEQSMQGRLEAERRKRKELEERLKTLEAQIGAAQSQHAQPDAQPGAIPAGPGDQVTLYGKPVDVATVDDETKILVEEFARKEPDLARLVVEDSKDGARLRRILNEFGSDYTATAAETVLQRRQVAQAEEARSSMAQAAVVRSHFQTLATQHPEFAPAFVGTTDDAYRFREELNGKLDEWANSLPYRDGLYVHNVLRGGTTEQVSFVLSKFKEAHAAPQAPAKQPDAVRRAAQAGLAVQTRSQPVLPKGQANKNEWDNSIWE